MKVILAVDALFPPLTGIGRYAAELALGLEQQAEVSELTFFAHGRFVGRPDMLGELGRLGGLSALSTEATATGSSAHSKDPTSRRPQSVPLAARARTRLARSTAVVRVYGLVAPRVAQWRLRAHVDCLFHSPNFLLPPCAGPSVATLHDLSTLRYPQYHPAARVALMDRAIPEAIARASALITPSQAIRREVIEAFGVAGDRVHATPLGVDPRYAPRDAQALQGTLRALGLVPGQYLLCVATLEPRKNIERLLKAFMQLPSVLRRRFPLVLAGGSGWHSDDLSSTIQRLSRSGEVRALGYVAEAQLPALHAGARLFAFPSLYEGFGLPVLEAMASGVPVITANCSSMPEVAAGAAILVNPLDTDAITAALQRGLEDEEWRHKAVATGLARAAELSWPRCIEATLELYRTLTP